MQKFFLVALRIIPAIILLQTLFFKFTGDPQSVEIFTKLGVEPWGRYLTGSLELISGILLLTPAKAIFGAKIAVILMVGAFGSHLFVLGFDGMNGQLGIMAIVVLLTSLGVIYTQNK